jgi:uncharacterized membrane protein YhaH (DUF805 family)
MNAKNVCLECNLEFDEDVSICPKCNKETINTEELEKKYAHELNKASSIKSSGSLNASIDSKEPMTVLQALFSFKGRMCRSDYWLKGFLVLLPIGIVNNILMFGVNNEGARSLAMIIGVLSLWPALALYVKRMHDRNRSGWYLATMLIPIANIYFMFSIPIEAWFLRGTVGANRFGDDPILETT